MGVDIRVATVGAASGRCPVCGAPGHDGVRACQKCGQLQVGGGEGYKLASRLERVGAQVIDILVVAFAAYLALSLSALLGTQITFGTGERGAADAPWILGGAWAAGIGLTVLLLVLIVLFLYSWANGQTPGKRMFGHVVVSVGSGKPAGFGTMVLREVVGKAISAAGLLVGYLWVLWGPDRRGWHDKIADTVVAKPTRTYVASGASFGSTFIGRFYHDNPSTARALMSFLIVVVVWQGVVFTQAKNSLAIAPLSAIVQSFYKLGASGELWKHIWTSTQEFALGFALAAVVGVILGIVIATSDPIRDFVDPWISFLYSTPTIALAPLFILVFGIGINSKVAVVFLLGVFPVVINTSVGIRSTDQHLIEAARSFCAGRMQIFIKVLIPSALSFIVAGLRLGIGRGLVGVVVGELFGARAGLGFLILISSQVFDTAGLFVGVITLAGTGILSVVLLQRLERRLAPWREFQVK